MKDGGRKSRRSTTPNIAALAPMPRPSVSTTAAVNPGVFRSPRTAYFTSCQIDSNAIASSSLESSELVPMRHHGAPEGCPKRAEGRAPSAESRELLLGDPELLYGDIELVVYPD